MPRRSDSERGQTFVEYVTLLALLSVLIVVALNFIGPAVAEVYDSAGQTISAGADDDGDDDDDDDGDGEED